MRTTSISTTFTGLIPVREIEVEVIYFDDVTV